MNLVLFEGKRWKQLNTSNNINAAVIFSGVTANVNKQINAMPQIFCVCCRWKWGYLKTALRLYKTLCKLFHGISSAFHLVIEQGLDLDHKMRHSSLKNVLWEVNGRRVSTNLVQGHHCHWYYKFSISNE